MRLQVLFLQNIWHEQLGVEYLAGYLRSRGVECDLRIVRSAGQLGDALGESRPRIVAFSSTTGSHPWALRTASHVKAALGCLTIMGGPHPTFYPDVINDPGIDIICRGEGERALYELAVALQDGRDITGIRNLWVKKNGSIHRNPLRPLEKDLDILPLPDRSVYDRYPLLRDDTIKPLMSSRGCPYVCSYCFNISGRDLYRGKGRYVRQRRVEKVIAEAQEILERYPVRMLNFVDDIFGINRKWLMSFLDSYEKHVRVPFLCNSRWELLDKDIARRMKSAGCRALQIGIESADERLRREVLGRGATNTEIVRKAAFLHELGLKFRTYNMVGLPGETIEQCLHTLELNGRIGADFPYVAIFQPYPGTPLGDKAVREGWVQADFVDSMPSTFHRRSVLTIEKTYRYENLHKFFLLIIRFPRLKRLWKVFISLPPNPLYQAIFLISTGLMYSRLTGRGLLKSMLLGIKHLRFYRGG